MIMQNTMIITRGRKMISMILLHLRQQSTRITSPTTAPTMAAIDISRCRRCLGIYEKAGVEHERYRKAAVENNRIHPAEYLIPVPAKRQIYEAADDREIKKGLEAVAFEKMK